MNPFGLVIFLTIGIFSGLPFLLNYFVLEKNLKYGIIIFFMVIFIVSFITGYIISSYSGNSKCKNSIQKVCFCKGFKQAVYSTLVYILVFFVPFFKSGFIGLMGNTFLANSLAESVIITLTNISLTIDNYFNSIQDNCKLDFNLSAAAWKRIEKKLNSKKKKDIKEMVEIKA